MRHENLVLNISCPAASDKKYRRRTKAVDFNYILLIEQHIKKCVCSAIFTAEESQLKNE
jgi:hypothetical protein